MCILPVLQQDSRRTRASIVTGMSYVGHYDFKAPDQLLRFFTRPPPGHPSETSCLPGDGLAPQGVDGTAVVMHDASVTRCASASKAAGLLSQSRNPVAASSPVVAAPHSEGGTSSTAALGMDQVSGVADACGEVPTIQVVKYNIARLRAIGYLNRFDGYLRQLGFTAEMRAAVPTADEAALDEMVRQTGAEAGWGADAEAHLRAVGCSLVLVVGDDCGSTTGLPAMDWPSVLESYSHLSADVRLLVGVDPMAHGSLDRALAVRGEPGFAGLAVSPFLAGVPLSDERYEPVLRAASDQSLPLWVHASAHFRPDVAYDIGHPRHLDTVMTRYPGLRLMIGHAGWPWVDEACIVALRHPTVAVEFSTFPPRLIATPGWSLEALLAHRVPMRGRTFFGSGTTSSARRMAGLLAELDGLELADDLPLWRGGGLRKWLAR